MRILQVSGSDSIGGAERIAHTLYRGYAERAHESWLAVEKKTRSDPHVLKIHQTDPAARLLSARPALENLYFRVSNRPFSQFGFERRFAPSSSRISDLLENPPDVLHMHNLHGWYFDLGALPILSARLPVMLTLHDAWLLSGHCAHSFDCDRWLTGCGHCPDLTIYPAIKRDETRANWQWKRSIYQKSRLYIATPSQWLMDKVQRSMLQESTVEARVIPNGIDLAVFQPGDRQEARARLNLPQEMPIILFAANGIRANPFKDYQVLRSALTLLGEKRRMLFLAIGEDAPAEQLEQAELRFISPITDPREMATYYQTADVYIHAARADTFPNTVIEAMACGAPVVASRVGGILEQVDDRQTGFLAPVGDTHALADGIARLLDDVDMRDRFSRAAAEKATTRFSAARMIDDYLAWYQTITSADQPDTPRSLS